MTALRPMPGAAGRNPARPQPGSTSSISAASFPTAGARPQLRPFLENLTSSVWSSMTEGGVAVAFVERLLLSLEPGKLALEIRDQHVGQIMAETPPDHES